MKFRFTTPILLACLAMAMAPLRLLAQEPVPPLRPAIDSLLRASRAEATVRDLGGRFLTEILVLLPDLSAEQQRVLTEAVEEGFAPAVVLGDLAGALADGAPAGLVQDLLGRYRSGAVGELTRMATAFQPPETASEFLARTGTPPRERLQLMVQLAELDGGSTVDLHLDESLQELAHGLLTRLGANLAPLERMSDERFDATYRERVLQRGFTNLHRLQPVSNDLLERALADLGGEAGRWYAEEFTEAMIAAASAAAVRVAALTVVEDDTSTPAPTPVPEPTVDEALHCQGLPCPIWVDWDGPEPTAFNARFGAPGALGARVLDNLGSTHFRIGGGPGEQGFMIRLVPRLTTRICDFMSGTDTERCDAIAQVMVEFRGQYGELPDPPDFTVVNRCGSDAALHVDGFAAFVALRIQHALYRPADPAPSIPRC